MLGTIIVIVAAALALSACEFITVGLFIYVVCQETFGMSSGIAANWTFGILFAFTLPFVAYGVIGDYLDERRKRRQEKAGHDLIESNPSCCSLPDLVNRIEFSYIQQIF